MEEEGQNRAIGASPQGCLEEEVGSLPMALVCSPWQLVPASSGPRVPQGQARGWLSLCPESLISR